MGLIGPAPMMTSLDMRGFSVSLLPITKAEFEDGLRAPVAPSGLAGLRVSAVVEVAKIALPDGLTPIKPIPSQHEATRAFIERCCRDPDRRRGRR